MRRYLILAFCALAYLSTYALKYEYRFTDTPLSTALTRISREHPELRLSFIYDELDNYRTSAHIDTDNGMEALHTLTTRLPVRVSQSRSGIYVEAMQRGMYRYTGRAVGAGGEGVPHATVMVLAPKDSTVLTYAFTDGRGWFSIPCDVRNVILKFNSVGYITSCRKASGFNVGDVPMVEAPVLLEGVTVKSERARIEMDKTVFMPGKREKNASHGGADLLLAMGLPTVRVNPLTKEITTSLGDEVQTFIDFLPADKSQVAGMRPQDVRCVEVYENPQDPRFNGARYVVNFVMVKYEYGGYTKWDASQYMPDPSGDFAVNSKFSYKKMTYDVSAGCFYEIDHRSRMEEQTNYQFPRGEVNWYLSTDDRRYNHNTEYATFRAVYSDTRSRVSNTIGYQGNNSRLRFRNRNVYTPQVYPDDISRSGQDFRSNSATWRGTYQFYLPQDVTLMVNPRLMYSHHFSSNSYTSDNKDIITDARENAWHGFVDVSGMKKWGKQSLTVSLYGEMADNKLHYVGSDLVRVHNFTDAVGVGVSSRLYFGRFWMSPSVSLYYSYQRFEDISDRQWLPKYYIELGYSFNERHKLSLSSEMSHWTVGVAKRSPNIVVRNLFDAVTGNPSLRPALFNSVQASYQWNVCQALFLSGFCRYRHWTRPITDVFTPVVIDGREMMLNSLTKDGYYSELAYGGSASMSLLNRSLSLWVTAYGTYARRGGKYNYSRNYPRCSGGINYYLKNFYFSGYYNVGSKGVTQDYRIEKRPSNYQLTAGWGAKGFNVSVTASNFLRSSPRAICVERIYENYSDWTREFYGPATSWGINIRLSYSFSYGRKVQHDNGPGSTGQIDSGILQ